MFAYIASALMATIYFVILASWYFYVCVAFCGVINQYVNYFCKIQFCKEVIVIHLTILPDRFASCSKLSSLCNQFFNIWYMNTYILQQSFDCFHILFLVAIFYRCHISSCYENTFNVFQNRTTTTTIMIILA